MRSESPADALPLSLLSDQPADEDQLNFVPYVRTLADVRLPHGDDPAASDEGASGSRKYKGRESQESLLRFSCPFVRFVVQSLAWYGE